MPRSWSNFIHACGRRAFLVLALLALVLAPMRIICLEGSERRGMVDVSALADAGVVADHRFDHDDGGGLGQPGDPVDPDAYDPCHCSVNSALLPDTALVLPRSVVSGLVRIPLPDIIPDDWLFAPEPPPNRV